MVNETRDTIHNDTRTTESHEEGSPARGPVPSLVILRHPDFRRVGEEAALPSLLEGGIERLSRLEPVFSAPDAPRSEPASLGDPHLSRRPILLTPGPTQGSIAFDAAGCPSRLVVGGRRVAPSQVVTAREIAEGVLVEMARSVLFLLRTVDPQVGGAHGFDLVGASPSMVELRREIRAAASLEVPTLLRGETGTGKELVARALHDASPRRHGPFVAVNMGALPPALAASELFGAARGAYTGADRRKTGLFASAHQGTLFLDEIGEAPPEVQVMLLRVLEEGVVQPVGSVESQKVDVRVLAATDTDLEQAVGTGHFRAPLLHRLAGYDIRLPTLRQRRDDIPRLLVTFLLEELDPQEPGTSATSLRDLPPDSLQPWPDTATMTRLVSFDWPGNVRQLRNVARRMVTAHRMGSPFDRLLDDLLGSPTEAPRQGEGIHPQAWPTPHATTPATADDETAGQPTAIPRRWLRRASEVDDDELLAALAAHRWQLRPTARELGLSRATLYRLIDACPRIRKAAELGRSEIEAALRRADGDHLAAAMALEVSPQGLKRRMTALGLP